LTESPGLFLAPAWSSNGKDVLFAAELDDEGPALYLANEFGEAQRLLVRYEGAISFLWSPKGDQVAYIETNRPRPSGLGQFAYGPIRLLDREGNAIGTVSTEDALALFWSPDSHKIAYLTIAVGEDEDQLQGRLVPTGTTLQQDALRLRWRVIDLRSGMDTTLSTFTPAAGFFSLLPFFDQYAQSLTLWSPDSDALVYSMLTAGGVAEVWIVAIDGKSVPQRIAEGDLPVWSWQ
jgi:Tol biopolymer transport system component